MTFTQYVDSNAPVYAAKRYRHFDEPLSAKWAFQLVTQPEEVLAKHAFLPFMSFNKKQRRYGRRFKGFGTRARNKIRPLKYASHRDGYIYAYYARRLGDVYEKWVQSSGLSDNVIAYRRTGKNNIDLAKNAFEKITELAPCKAFALDLKSFFESIPHRKLLENWQALRGGPLPVGEYKVYRSLTKYASCDKESVVEALKKAGKFKDAPKGQPLRFCEIQDYRKYIKVVTHPHNYGVPQGSAMSALLSNIAMMELDIALKDRVEGQLKGIYRRYSDDVLIVLPTPCDVDFEAEIPSLLGKHVGPELTINDEKTVRCAFTKTNGVVSSVSGNKNAPSTLDYLGFCFDGKRVLLRSSTLSRYWRRLKWKIQTEQDRAERFAEERATKGQPNIRMRKIIRQFTAQNFRKAPNAIRYALVSSHIFDEKAIRKQIAKHRKTIRKKLG
jgi:hypothetical protein